MNNNETSVKYFFQTFLESCKLLFTKKNESKLQNDLNVKKGFLQSLKYLMFIFLTFPMKILNVFLRLDYDFYFFIERFVLVLLAYFKDDIYKVLATNYERYVKAQLEEVQDVVTADIQTIQYVINFYRLFRITVALIVFILLLTAGYLGILAFSVAFSSIFSSATSATMLVTGGVGGFFVGLLIKAFLFLAVFIVALILSAHILYVTIKILTISVQSFQNVKSDDLAQFIMLALDYTILKTKELYSEEVAKNALFMLLENFKSKKSDINVDDNVLIEYLEEYKLLENKENKN